MDYIGKFEADYKREAAIYECYNNAKTAENLDKTRKEMDAFIKRQIKSEGNDYARVYQLYASARNRGNKHINFNDLRSETPAEVVGMLRKFDINIFTFSSRWSGMIDNLARFIEAGCQFCGMAEIFSNHKKLFSDEYETENAIVFYIK